MDLFDQYQKNAKKTLNSEVEEPYLYANLGMGLAGEAGEVCDYLKKLYFTDIRLIKIKYAMN